MIEKQPSCDDDSEPELLPVEEARKRLFSSLRPVEDGEQVGLSDVLHRVLSQDVKSSVDVPPEANSAMDGYAISAACIPAAGEATLRVTGSAWAGRPFTGTVSSGEAIRIFTGAVIPEGTDTVVIQEHVRAQSDAIEIDDSVVAGKNVRQAGEDVALGQVILTRGHCLQAADIGVLASLGIHTVDVYRRLRIAFFTTGDELQALDPSTPDGLLHPGMVFDSNRYTLSALLSAMPVEVVDLGIIRDNEEDTRAVLQHAASVADVVISSGGVSAGDADYVTRAFHDVGDVSFWKLAMRPGRPLAYGSLGKASFFGLPGNPVAVMVTFLQFVQPVIRYLSGRLDVEPLQMPARCLSRLRKSPGRVEFQRGVLSLDEAGLLVVSSTGKQGAGRLSSMSAANCLIVIGSEADGVEPGDTVSVQPFYGLLPG